VYCMYYCIAVDRILPITEGFHVFMRPLLFHNGASVKFLLIIIFENLQSINLCEFTVHCNENHISVFPEKEFYRLCPNFHIHVSVNDLYIPRISPHTYFPAAE
jgi:hypothetical protein